MIAGWKPRCVDAIGTALNCRAEHGIEVLDARNKKEVAIRGVAIFVNAKRVEWLLVADAFLCFDIASELPQIS